MKSETEVGPVYSVAFVTTCDKPANGAVIPEIVRFDPDADPAHSGTVYARLLDYLRSGHLAEMRDRSLPPPPARRPARFRTLEAAE